MKIVFFAPFGIRPKGTLIARMLPLAEELQKLGHTTTIIAPPYTNPEDSGKTEFINGIKLLNVTLAPFGRAFSTLPVAWRMLRAGLSEKPDIITLFKPKGYGGMALMLIIILKKIGFKLPSVFVDSDDLECAMNELHSYSVVEKIVYCFQEKWLLANADAVTVASRELENFVQKMGVKPEQLLYLPNCVKQAKRGSADIVKKKFNIASDAPLLLLYTRFFEFEQQRLHTVLQEIKVALPAVKFLVVGKGRNSEEAMLLNAAKEKGFADSLIIAGWVLPEDLPDYFAAADIAIYPLADNLINRCKCPAKLTELLLAALPVVADAVGQVKEYIKPGISGLLVDPNDWHDIATKTVELLSDSLKMDFISKNSTTYILLNFNWQDYARKLEKFYMEQI